MAAAAVVARARSRYRLARLPALARLFGAPGPELEAERPLSAGVGLSPGPPASHRGGGQDHGRNHRGLAQAAPAGTGLLPRSAQLRARRAGPGRRTRDRAAHAAPGLLRDRGLL